MLTAILLACLLALAMAGDASAGTYVISNCPAAVIPNGDPGPWTIFNSPQPSKGSCGGGSGDWIGPRAGSMGWETIDGVQVTTPKGSGITIREAKVWWSVPHEIEGALTYALVFANGSIVGEYTTPAEWKLAPAVYVLPSTTTTFTLEDFCSNSAADHNCVFGSGLNPNLQLYGSELTLDENTLPTGAVTGGNLSTTSTLSGTATLAYAAQDANSGVRRAQLIIDGKAVAEKDYAPQCPYANFAACPTSLSDELHWTTTEASNGTHEAALRITSAAGTTALLDEHTITINNQPTQTSNESITGSGPTAQHIANGQPCAGEKIDLEINGQHAPTTAYGHQTTIKGVLHCGTVPIRNARIAITTLDSTTTTAINTSIETALDGSFSYVVPRGPDRLLQFSYTAYSDDPGPSATAAATISIRPAIKLRISPRYTRNGRAIRWTGAIAGGPLPAQGVTLDVEVRQGRHWRIFDQVVATRTGRFHYIYRFHATNEPTTYKFRVALPANGSQGYPYTPGPSNTVAIHVTP